MLDLSSWDFKVIDEMDYLTSRDMNIKWMTTWKWSLFSYRDEVFFIVYWQAKQKALMGQRQL